MQDTTPVSERPNSLTADIDVVEVEDMLALLAQTDAQMFSGYLLYPALPHPTILDRILDLAAHFANALAAPDSSVVLFTGAGTSGRLALLAARAYNAASGTYVFDYRMAGGDRALVRAQESAEDSGVAGHAEAQACLSARLRTGGTGVVVGITAGLSAAYVGGAMAAGRGVGAVSAVVGFSPPALARPVPLGLGPASLADEIHAALAVTPVVGPEAVTGSTRMKGGSATRIVLDTAFCLARLAPPRRTRLSAACMLARFQSALLHTRLAHPSLARLASLAGDTLRRGGRLLYVGHGELGRLAMVDASECPPTFGARFDAVRAFLAEGWAALPTHTPPSDLSASGPLYRISITDFEDLRARGEVGPGDLVILLAQGPPSPEQHAVLSLLPALAPHIPTALVSLAWQQLTPDSPVEVVRHPDGTGAAVHVEVTVECAGEVPQVLSYAGLAGKVVLNAVTTVGHILSGMVYGNRMVNLRVSNSKLYLRAIGIVQALAQPLAPSLDRLQAEDCLLAAIYARPLHEPLPQDIARDDIPTHVSHALQRERVVSIAVLLASGVCGGVAEAEGLLAQQPVVRHILRQHGAEGVYSKGE